MINEFQPADRLDLPGYPFAELERKASEIRAAGKPLYDLSIGDPDLPPPKYITDAVKNALNSSDAHRYPSSRGALEIRESVAHWYQGRFGVSVDPATQICLLIGAKEGLGQLARAIVNPGDVVAVPNPAYPVYGRAGCKLVAGVQRTLMLNVENGFMPSISELQGSKLVFLNYPNNPTGAETNDDFLRKIANIADNNPAMTIAFDMAYSEVYFDEPPPSLLQYTSNAIELHSLSKMANATGFRIGFAVGEPERISALRRMKEENDSGAPLPFQFALKEMLDRYNGIQPPDEVIESNSVVKRRRRIISDALTSAGYEVFKSEATFYIWFKVGGDETEFIDRAIDHGILLTPGSGFGSGGQGWVRASVTAPDEDIEKAAERLSNLKHILS